MARNIDEILNEFLELEKAQRSNGLALSYDHTKKQLENMLTKEALPLAGITKYEDGTIETTVVQAVPVDKIKQYFGGGEDG